ncbi:MAG: telomere resolvase [Spirirestis rafaelensis WJT71-NPBG6]|jgi:hypothetical protein|nr:telomere resolvase [Spirirestis rafaelensis WJT71-NPBG6]
MTPEDLRQAIKDLKTEDEIKAVAIAFDKWAREKYTTLESLRTHMTPYNKVVKSFDLIEGKNAYYYRKDNGELVLKHLFFKYAGLKQKEYQQLNIKSNNQKEERLDNGTLLEPESYLEDLGKLLTSDEADELALGLIGATGRRPCEVLLRGDFVTAKESDLTFPQYQPVSHWLKFSGQAKKRRNTAVNYTPIAVLFPADFILKSVKRLRKMPEVATVIKEIAIEVTALELPKLKEQYSGEALEYQVAIKENEYLDNRFGSKQNKLLQTQLKSLDVRHGKNSVSRSSLRAAYARLAVARDCPPGKNDLVWASRLLGHMDEKADLRAVLTTLGYFDYYLEKDAEVPLLDTPKSEITVVFRGYANDVEAVKAFQEKFDITSQPETFRKLWELAQETLQQRERQLYTQETEEMINDELLAKIDEIVEAKVSKALADFNSKPDAMPGTATLKANALNTPTAETLPIETTKVSTLEPIKPLEKDWEAIPSEDLKGKHTPGSAEEKIRRTVKAIMDHNNYKAPSNNERWFLGVRSIQDLSGCNYAPIKKYVDDHKTMINDHNSKFSLSNQHNKKHSQKISDVITW